MNTSNYQKYSLIFIILFFFTQINSQCTEENLSTNALHSNSLGVGQTFMACEDGLIEEISFQTGGIFTPTNVTLNLRNSSCTIIWTVPNVSTSPNSTITIDLSAGSGTTRNAISGDTYTFNLVWPSGGSGAHKQVKYSGANPYSGGFMTRLNCTNWPAPNDDLWFQVGIDLSLPVLLHDFNGEIINDHIELKWETATEINNKGFEVQKSIDGENWDVVGFQNGKGNTSTSSNYQFQIKQPSHGINYFRLKQIDYNENFEYSNIVRLVFDRQIPKFVIYPNPSKGNVNLNIDNFDPHSNIKIIDTNGIIHFEMENLSNIKDWNKSITLQNPGLYILIVDDKKKIVTKKFLIE